uniref:Uncharacterized protein n=1 Tax=Anguilla anguilla TaxID=7936 RepID=A0A0E9RES8_ANGAN
MIYTVKLELWAHVPSLLFSRFQILKSGFMLILWLNEHSKCKKKVTAWGF